MRWTEAVLESQFVQVVGGAINTAFRLPNPIAIEVDGLDLYAQSLDRLIALLVIKFGRGEQAERRFAMKALRSGDVVVDIGANVGQYTLMFSSLVGEEGKVFAFEPAPDNYRLLKLAIEANQRKNVIAIELAVTDFSDWTSLHVSALHHGDHRIFQTEGNRNAIQVRSTSLDEDLLAEPRIDLIKMDVQGAEPLALRGMRQLVQKHPGLTILTEFSPMHLRAADMEPSDFLEEIRDQNLYASLLDRDGNLHHSEDLFQSLESSSAPSTLVLKRK